MIPAQLKDILVGAIELAEKGTYKDIKEHDLNGEENITIDLLKSIKIFCSQAIEKYKDTVENSTFEVTTKDFPKTTMEPEVGADFAITVRKYLLKNDVTIPKLVKSILVQAKLPKNPDYGKLKKQIRDMNDFTKESYVAVYDDDQVYIVKSIDVINADYRVKKVPLNKRQSLSKFFSDIFECRKGEIGFDARGIKPEKDLFYHTPIGETFIDHLDFTIKETIRD
ncbi:hypothetical protein BSK66_31810 [Paenibacillus odorifer]|uniref:hypothetical protein n=1 Tax=Paenibacillus TaxID=44249 RepID=UPI0003E1C2B7|nr:MULTISPECIES: hypothetical protein [Paenibacillus]ETT61023.1 hypothetical protein C171_13425 [Paenibacillus sp. FSL H8-237]OMD13697.1 hypothetical protein BJP47_24015 [Paenibacillus odorifer]OME46555.1 hypothetical protein BSK66_31810 [Paenibacillus odorifer]